MLEIRFLLSVVMVQHRLVVRNYSNVRIFAYLSQLVRIRQVCGGLNRG